MLKLKALNGKRCFALLLCFSLVCGCCPKFFSAKAATIVTETLPADKEWFVAGGSIAPPTTGNRAAYFHVEGGQPVTITRSGETGGGTRWWEISCFTEEPYLGITGGQQLLRVTGSGDNPVIVTPPEGYDWLVVCPVINATSSTNIFVTVEFESTIVIPDVPSYDGTTSGSSSVITGIQQGYEFDGVSIDTVTSQLTASLVEETVLPIDDEGDGITDDFVLKSVYKVPVLVSCTITNTRGDYAWLNDKTIGYTPTFNSNIPLLADAATEYKLCDIFYTSKGFADAITTDGTIHFRFDDSNYYLGDVVVKPMSTLSASALLYYDITVIMTVPADAEYYSYLTAVAMIMRTTIINSVGLSGIDAVQSYLEFIPTDATTTGQEKINDNVVSQGEKMQQAVQALQDQQQMQYNDFINPSPDAGNDMVNGGIGSVNEKLGIFTAVEGILQNTLGLFSEENIGDTRLVFPAFGMEIQGEQYQFWNDTEYDLSSLEEPFGVLLGAVRLGTALVVYGALLMYLQKVFAEIIGGSDE